MTTTETWLYGSVARDTHTKHSDLDILVISDDVESEPLPPTIANLPQYQHLATRRYSWNEIERMAAYGSLFLLHLKLEGRPLDVGSNPTRLSSLLMNLPRYRHEARDILGFRQALDDVQWGIQDSEDDGDIAFELGTIATVIRHCSILACYKCGTPQFQTDQSIRTAFQAVSMGSLSEDAVRLYDFRLASSRGIAIDRKPSRQLATQWLTHATDFVERVRRLL